MTLKGENAEAFCDAAEGLSEKKVEKTFDDEGGTDKKIAKREKKCHFFEKRPVKTT